MDAVEIFLFCVVGFSVLAFLILGYLEERRKICRDTTIYDYEEEEKSVGAGTEKQIISKDFRSAEIVEEEEERENPVSVSCEKPGFASAISDVSVKNNCEKEEEFIDDWEGIERTGLDKIFGEALIFVNCKCNHDQIHEDLKLVLYGLSKIALEGPCYGSQPMALKVSARSKWNAWQKLGNMSREMAMENYIDILSKAIPSWKGENAAASEDLT